MNIALINEKSQAAKNELIFNVLKTHAEEHGHEVCNYGMFGEEDHHEINFTQIGIMASVLLESGAADFVVTGCGTGQGAMISCNAFSNVVCGFAATPLDAHLFAQVNAGNAISIPYAQSFGWGSELNLGYIFDALFSEEFGRGYPEVYAEGQAKSRIRMMEATKIPAQRPVLEALELMDARVLKDLFGYPQFSELFFNHARPGELTDFISSLIG